jgi:hypothetical protein
VAKVKYPNAPRLELLNEPIPASAFIRDLEPIFLSVKATA